jgi:hypothetical protein
MQYLILTFVFLLCWLGAWATFTNRIRDGGIYLPLMLAVSVGTGYLFALGSRMLGEKERIFVFSLQYDVCMAAAYYLLPVLFFGCTLRNHTIAGAVLVVAGLAVIHLGGD